MVVATLREAEQRVLRGNLNYTAFDTAVARYPLLGERVMPTRLGNVLRRWEDLAGAPYGVDALALIPHLLALAPGEAAAVVDDARTDLDIAVRFVLAWLVTAVLTSLLVWPYGAWLAVPVAAYGLAWLSYRGAVHSAGEYGAALCVLVDLHRDLLSDLAQAAFPDADQKKAIRSLSAVARRDSGAW